MRVWAMMDRGSLDGSVPNADPDGGDKQGVYFQYWDPVKKAPAYNDGPNGLERLDYVLAKAAELSVKVIMVMVNNWRAFGGIDQYLMWYGRDKHHEFFTAPEIKQAYKNWVEHVVMRKNTITGSLYRDDPTIFSWGLANEPRCKGGAPSTAAPAGRRTRSRAGPIPSESRNRDGPISTYWMTTVPAASCSPSVVVAGRPSNETSQ